MTRARAHGLVFGCAALLALFLTYGTDRRHRGEPHYSLTINRRFDVSELKLCTHCSLPRSWGAVACVQLGPANASVVHVQKPGASAASTWAIELEDSSNLVSPAFPVGLRQRVDARLKTRDIVRCGTTTLVPTAAFRHWLRSSFCDHYVALSVGGGSADHASALRLAAATWLYHLGIKPVYATFDHLSDLDSSLAQAGSVVLHYNGLPAAFGNIGRLALPLLPEIDACALVVMSDADMLPLSAAYFWGHFSQKGAQAFLLNGLHPQTLALKEYPMCYAGAAASLWRTAHLNTSFDRFVQDIGRTGHDLPFQADQELLFRLFATIRRTATVNITEYHGLRVERDLPILPSSATSDAVDYHMVRPLRGACSTAVTQLLLQRYLDAMAYRRVLPFTSFH